MIILLEIHYKDRLVKGKVDHIISVNGVSPVIEIFASFCRVHFLLQNTLCHVLKARPLWFLASLFPATFPPLGNFWSFGFQKSMSICCNLENAWLLYASSCRKMQGLYWSGNEVTASCFLCALKYHFFPVLHTERVVVFIHGYFDVPEVTFIFDQLQWFMDGKGFSRQGLLIVGKHFFEAPYFALERKVFVLEVGPGMLLHLLCLSVY